VLLLAGVNSAVVRFYSGDHLCHCEVAFNVLLMSDEYLWHCEMVFNVLLVAVVAVDNCFSVA